MKTTTVGKFSNGQLSSLWEAYQRAWRKADKIRAERARTGTFELDLQPKGRFPLKSQQV